MPAIPHTAYTDSHSFDFKLARCTTFALTNWITQDPKNERIKLVQQFYRGNVSRTRALMLVPAQSALLGMDLQRWVDVAEFEIHQTVPNIPLTREVSSAEVHARVLELSRQQMEEERKAAMTPSWDDLVRERIDFGVEPVNRISTAIAAFGGIEAMLASYVTGVWTSIEAMTGDLWEEAVNLQPDILATLDGKMKLGKDPDRTKADREESKSIKVELLREYGWDVHNKMGTLLRKKYEFSRLAGIREAYAAAFSKNSTGIQSALTSKSLDALSVVRNLIVHKGHAFDREYIRRAADLSLPAGELGKKLLLDGEMVVNLIKPAIDAGARLITAVDTWLTQNR